MADDRFTSQAQQADQLLKDQIVGLVDLEELRKRRIEALERSERERERDQDDDRLNTSQLPSGAGTPSDRSQTPQPPVKKRRKTGKGKLSFAVDEEEGDERPGKNISKKDSSTTPRKTGAAGGGADDERASAEDSDSSLVVKRKLGPNTTIANAPRVMTKAVLLKETQERERLRKEFLSIQEAVKATEIMVPFVFYDGTNVPGGATKVKKGDPIWLFLDKCRKFGADLRIGRAGQAKSRRDWARIGVDDLMLVRKDIIIPHHYEFYYFVINKTLGRDSLPLFDYSSKPSTASQSSQRTSATESHDKYSSSREDGGKTQNPDSNLEGTGDDPNLTKVVNRQWYERNKHIFPASTWQEFDPEKDYTNAIRRDAQGNSYFSQ